LKPFQLNSVGTWLHNSNQQQQNFSKMSNRNSNYSTGYGGYGGQQQQERSRGSNHVYSNGTQYGIKDGNSNTYFYQQGSSTPTHVVQNPNPQPSGQGGRP
jgi:hypothetical protein